MRTGSALALTAAGVIFTAGAAAADPPAPSPTGGEWTVTDLRTADGTSSPWTVTRPTTDDGSPSAPSSTATPAPQNRRTPSAQRRRPVARTGHRDAASCRPFRSGIWIVRPGDTLWQISACTRRRIAELVTLNDLPDGGRLIFPGDAITIR